MRLQARASVCASACAMLARWGVILVDWLFCSSGQGFAGRTAYNVSKMGMTMVAMGVAEECKVGGGHGCGLSSARKVLAMGVG